MALKPLKSSVSELKTFLEKTSISVKGITEKLEILDALANEVATNIVKAGRMNLKLSELEELLAREAYCSTGDAKHIVGQLIKLRNDQIERLGGYVCARSSSPTGSQQTGSEDYLESVLKLLPMMAVGKVCDVFAPESTKKRKGDAPDPPPCKEPKIQERKKQELTESERQELKKLLEDMEDLIEKPLLAVTDGKAEPEQQAGLEDRESRRKEAEQAVERILANYADTNDITMVLGGGSATDRNEEFHRLTRLLHPDRRLVTGDRADMALRMILVCMKKFRARS